MQDELYKALEQRKDAIFTEVGRVVQDLYPDQPVLETEDRYFVPERTGDDWTLDSSLADAGPGQLLYGWHTKENQVYRRPTIGWFEVRWQEQVIKLLRMEVQGEHCPKVRWYVIDEHAGDFFEHVCRYHSTVKGEVLVFQEGHWHSDEDLYGSIQSSDYEEVVLHGDLKQQIVGDIELFFSQQHMYERFRIPWKRGMLFLGPPGNGKTHMLRVLMKHFDRPCLYVKSFQAQYRSSQQCVAEAFERAREVAPCFFVLEDLDTLLTGQTRSFFLNEMDGFASNHGIVTLATCNFPEKLDPAILERPSRFDRKYHFELPNPEDRQRYMSQFMTRFDSRLQLSSSDLQAVAVATEGYSYAYLKELYVSSAVRWVSTDQHRPLLSVMEDQAVTLRDQMTTEWAEPAASPESGPMFPWHFGHDDDD